MTSKMAMASVPLGGGKAVLAVPEIPQGQARRELFLRYGDLVESLHGTYWTACDMNTGPPDMDVIAERSSSVFGRTEAAGGSGTSAPRHGRRRLPRDPCSGGHAFGSDDLDGRTVAVQGVGAVGEPLSRFLAEAGARLTLADVDDVRAKELAEELEADDGPGGPGRRGRVRRVLAVRDRRRPERGDDPSLRCRVIAGAANNQLGRAGRRRASGRTRHPVRARLRRQRRWRDPPRRATRCSHESDAQVAERLLGIGATLGEVFGRADAEGISTGAAADEIVEQRLAAGRAA